MDSDKVIGPQTDFSLFEGDFFNWVMQKIGFKSRGFFHLTGRILLLILLTWLPVALLFAYSEHPIDMTPAMNLFGDFAAHAQAFLGYPLFIIAERHIGRKTRAAAHHFYTSGVIAEEDFPELNSTHKKLAKLRSNWIAETLIIVFAYACAFGWAYEETHNSYDTWHALGAPLTQTLTPAGKWLAFISIPIFNYLWIRWLWKINLWCWYLYKVSRLKLRLIASHPDMTGGLEFLSDAQTSFAVLIFAYGIGAIAPLIAYKLEIEGASIASFSVAGPLFGFTIGAPILFTLPLLMFTKQLSRTKRRAVNTYQDRAREAAIYFEEKWLHACHDGNCDELLGAHLSGMNNLTTAYEHIRKMRVVPFDTRSFVELFGSAFGSLLPIVPKLVNMPEPVIKILEFGKDLLKG